MATSDETDPEIQVRLHHERECRRIAELITAELPEDRAFILLTVTRGLASESFSSLAYVASVRAQDSVRLLQEHIGVMSAHAGVAGEPTWRTATVMRELVNDLLGGLRQAMAGKQPAKA